MIRCAVGSAAEHSCHKFNSKDKNPQTYNWRFFILIQPTIKIIKSSPLYQKVNYDFAINFSGQY